MTFGSLFAGVGGFDLGLQRAGLTSRWQVEIDPFCRRVLAHHWPAVTRYEDVRAVCGRSMPWVDVLCGGFPCQDVSIAGKRKGLAGERSGLFFQFTRIAAEMRPTWVLLENVDGLLSTHAGADFGLVLRELEGVGYVAGAWRVLDSRWFGVPQRRNRVFIVGCLGGSGRRPESVLFESARGGWDPPAGRQAKAHVATTPRGRSHGAGVSPPGLGLGGEDDMNLVLAQNGGDIQVGTQLGAISASYARQTSGDLICGQLGGGNDGIGRRSEDDPNLVIAHALSSSSSRTGRLDPNGETFIASALTSSMGHHGYGSPRGDANDNLIAPTLGTSRRGTDVERHHEVVYALGSHSGAADADASNRAHAAGGPVGMGIQADMSHTLRAGRPGRIGGQSSGVRRLSPLECERLQAFPDGWSCLCGVSPYSTRACRCKDGPRYKALGNAVTVNVIQWIGRRLKQAAERAA